MIATLHFVSQATQAGQAVIITSWVELLTCGSIIGFLFGAYKHSRCHESTCRREWRGRRLPLRRRGKYPHGHLKLCHIHHPMVPNDGKVTATHIKEESIRKAGPAAKLATID